MNKFIIRNKQRGFSILMLSIWLLGIGLSVATVLALLPSQSDQQRIEETLNTMEDTHDMILGFVSEQHRLPAPGTSTNGTENPGQIAGALPYRSMELPEYLLDEASIPLRYSPYRSGATNLSTATNDFVKTLPDLPALPDLSDLQASLIILTNYTVDQCTPVGNTAQSNLLDFCAKLDDVIAAVANTSAVNIAPGNANVAYALVSGGLEDADGDGADRSLDGLNDDGDVSYDDPARGRQSGYDDIVQSVTFAEMKRHLSCEAITESVEMLFALTHSSKVNLSNTLSAYNDAEVAVAMAGVAVALDAIAIAQTAAAAVGIAADIGKAATMCNIPPNVICCPALAANIGLAVVHAVNAVVQITALIVDSVALADAIEYADLFENTIVPTVNDHLCTAIDDAVAAYGRSGLIGRTEP
jgi:hypothetical protein